MKKLLIVLLAATMSLTACMEPEHPSADAIQHKQQEQLSAQGVASVGMPAITQFAEKRMMKDILEMRDKMVSTITYLPDVNGKLHKMCDSLGFGLNGATQYTNPMKVGYVGQQVGVATLPQADPNGLFSPPSDNGTYVMCKNPHGKDISPVRFEPNMIISPFPLE